MGFIQNTDPLLVANLNRHIYVVHPKWQVHGEGSESQGPTELVLVGSGSYEQSWRAIPTQRPGPETIKDGHK